MNSETYLNHPTFGLLYKISSLEENQELYTTLYAQRLFFLVSFVGSNFSFEAISRSEARMMVEQRLRKLRRAGAIEEYQSLQAIHKRI
ncbi:MAG: transcriptional coactivator PipX [Halothece sp.]